MAPLEPRLVVSATALPLLLVLLVPRVDAAEPCEPVGARVVSVQGRVEVQSSGSAQWSVVALDSTLCVGDTVRVGALSRAALELPDNPTLRLDQLTTLRLVGTTESGNSWLDLLFGMVHIFSRQPHALRIDTPVANAGTEGTEFLLRVSEDRTEVVTFEGRVRLTTPQGDLLVASGDAAVAVAGEAPARQIVVRPRDAVAWTLYYPPILAPLAERGPASPLLPPGLRAAIDRVAANDYAGAIAALDAVPGAARDARYFTYRAGVLLNVGQAEAAEEALARALALDPTAAEALAQRAVLRVTQNRRDEALTDARRAVELSPDSAPSRIALSYALQATFALESARAELREAVERDPENALAWARLAELEQSFGDLNAAQRAAERAVALAPMLARTQMVLGFAALTRIDIDQAKAAFERAIALDSALPLARLGLGLATIRSGDLDAGGRDLEIAVALDPDNSLLRSYLGKAYFEERRAPLDAEQFQIAKELDPNDPTPWLYDAIRLQTENRPVEALRSLERSIALNDDRAVYRSRLLLDEDRATRGASLARIYDDLGFEQLGVNEATQSLALDPTNAAAHRFLADLYLGRPRLEAAQVSELLQSQLLQPVGRNPIRPSLGFTDLDIVANSGPARPGFNEFTPLFTRDGVQLDASGLIGTDSTYGNEAVVTALFGRTSISAGQFHYQTDGFRSNNDLKHNVYTVFGQTDLTPNLSLQAEYRYRKTDRGDRERKFDLENFSHSFRDNIKQDVVRVGGRLTPAPGHTALLSGIYTDRHDDNNRHDKDEPLFEVDKSTNASQLEGQYITGLLHSSLIVGGGLSHSDIKTSQSFGDLSRSDTQAEVDAHNLYVIGTTPVLENIDITWRIGYTDVEIDEKDANAKIGADGLTPAVGVTWQALSNVRLRAALGRTIKRPYVANQTLQPTQVAGFNEQYDDRDAVRADWIALGVDMRAAPAVRLGAEAMFRDLSQQTADGRGHHKHASARDAWAKTYVYWTLNDRLSASVEAIGESFSAKDRDNPDVLDLRTVAAPIRLTYTTPAGWFAVASTTPIAQDVDFPTSDDGKKTDRDDRGVLVDLAAGYRLPQRRGSIAFEVTNLFDRHLSFQDDSFRIGRAEFNPRFLPSRAFFASINLSF